MTTGEITGLLRFAAASEVERGFAWLDDAGRPQPGRGLPLWITARMTYVFTLASVLPGLDPALAPERRRLAEHGVRALATTYADPEHGGWFCEVSADGEPLDATKACYEHAFVVLAAGHRRGRQGRRRRRPARRRAAGARDPVPRPGHRAPPRVVESRLVRR